ncbi:MAG: DUF434 domain-containing protein [Verrucomicrobiales bacterium]|nr:DUF434 domain-containing protein [Verrucomicrobiales bacterium]
MPDSLKRRGKHPQDEAAFHQDCVPRLLAASADLAWLKSRGYADPSSLKLVGDRYHLNSRQRTAVARSTCSDQQLQSRRERLIPHSDIKDRTVYIDGFNLLTSIEAYLGQGILLIGRDGVLRDMSSMHGNYRVLEDTKKAIDVVHRFLAPFQPGTLHWLLDQPVSNSGRLKSILLQTSASFPVEVELVPDPDKILRDLTTSDKNPCITADSGILDHCGYWLNTAREITSSLSFGDRIVIDFS